jgi:hypothetical protein
VNYGFKEILVRTVAEPRLLVPEIEGRMHQIDPDIPFAQVQTIDEVVEEQTGGRASRQFCWSCLPLWESR